MNEIVKYHNDFSGLALKDFNAIELDLLMVLCSKMRNKQCEKVVFDFEQLKTLSKYKPTANKRFIEDIKRTNEKLMKLNMCITSEDMIYQFVLFPTFGIDTKNMTLTVAVNQQFAFVLNELTQNFTRFELDEFISLTSGYSKALYRLMKQYRTEGRYYIKVEDIKEQLDIPASYTPKRISDNILKPVMKELSAYFDNLKLNKITSKRRGNPIIAYEFIFRNEIPPKTENRDSTEGKSNSETRNENLKALEMTYQLFKEKKI